MASLKSPKKFKTTKDIDTSTSIVDQVIGQDEAINIIKKAARQRRNVLLIGEPGTGKSLTGQALADLIPEGELDDVLSIDNPSDEHQPLVRTFPKGKGIEQVNRLKIESLKQFKGQMIFFYILIVISLFSPWWVRKQYGDIMAAASLISSMMFIAIFVLFMNLNKKARKGVKVPKVLIEAAACEKPIITTDMPGCREIVIHKHNGFLVEPHSPEVIAEHVKQLLEDDELCKQMGKEGRRLVESEFSIEKVNLETLLIYGELLGATG